MKINDLNVGQRVSIDLVLSECSIRKTKGNPPRDFLSATLTDGTDTLDGKIWNYPAAKGVPESGKVYTCVGQIGEYQGKKQITLDVFEQSVNQSLDAFQPVYTEDYADYYDRCNEMIDLINNKTLKTITRKVYTIYAAPLKKSSSAKGVHHVGIGGNIVHSYEVAEYACELARAANRLGYNVNIDLCIAGALLHDIGKAYTYAFDGAVVTYAPDGRLVDHIVLGVEMLDRVLWDFTDLYKTPEADMLRHIICSHHGELEYGSPTVPICMEAHIVNYADGMSATLNTIMLANRKAEAEGKSFTDRIFTQHNREYILQKDVLADG